MKVWLNTAALLEKKLYKADISKAQLARDLGLHINSIYDYCRGDYPPAHHVMGRIQERLSITVEEITQAMLADAAASYKNVVQRQMPWAEIKEVIINADVHPAHQATNKP